MPVCYFNAEYNAKYNCDYEIKDGTMEIVVDYDIMDEVETVNGVRTYGVNTRFDKRDILIIDSHSKKNYLAKQAFWAGSNELFGTPDSGAQTKFRAHTYFEHGGIDELTDLPVTPKVNKIKIFSKSIIDWIGCPSLEIIKSENCYTIKLSKEYEGSSITLNSNYIKQITVSDNWSSVRSRKDNNITIDFSGYIELELTRRVNYDKVPEFVNELLIFMQLYSPDRFYVDTIYVMVDGTYFILNVPLLEIKHSDKYIERTVNDNLLDFLKKCYTRIPYRNSKTEIRNIPYIILKTSRSVEDSFLMFYRFIECYYKKETPEARRKFISFGINEHYANKHSLSENQIENYTQEIICLRNHYVHGGYYIKNSSLRVSFDKIGRRKNPKDYTANNVDIHWIYDRTKILYHIVIDIIYRNMLGYSEYRFTKHF